MTNPLMLEIERPRDINLIRHVIRKTLLEMKNGSLPLSDIAMKPEALETLMKSNEAMTRQLCDD